MHRGSLTPKPQLFTSNFPCSPYILMVLLLFVVAPAATVII